MGLSKDPTQACTTPATDQKKLENNHTGIVVVTFGTLFLISQLFLVLWVLTAFSRKKEHEKSTANSPSTSVPSLNANINDNDSLRSPLKARRGSTWSGAALEHQYLHQQEKCEGLDEHMGLNSPLSSSITESESDRSVRRRTREMIDEAIAMPMSAQKSIHLRISPDSPVADSGPELKAFNTRKGWVEMGLMAATIAKPRSPRSPKINAADHKAMMEAFAADVVVIGVPYPTPVIVGNAEALASGFDVPLGVNPRLASQKKVDPVLGSSKSESE